MTQELTPFNGSPLARLGQVANEYAARSAFQDYQEKLTANTRRRQKADLALFSRYLAGAGVLLDPEDLRTDPFTWEGMTHGLVKGFVRWMLQEGYSIGSVNVRLATIKAYCAVVCEAHVIPESEFGLIKLVRGLRRKEARNIDQQRKITRVGDKKASPVSLSRKQVALLKKQPDTPQGCRDALLMCFLLDLGLRCGELYDIRMSHINLAEGTLVFYREKVDKVQTHELSKDTIIALQRYLEVVKPQGRLLVGSRKGGKLIGGMSRQAITDRVRILGEAIGIEGLSAHDCRHYWSTAAIRGGTDIKSLQDAGGWSNPAMALRYAEDNKIANKGVKLG